MATLKSVFEGLGLERVETFIASGNVIFETSVRAIAPLESRIEAALLDRLGYEVATFIRTPAEIVAIVKHRPFPGPAMAAALSLNVGLLKGPPPPEKKAALARLKTDSDEVRAHGSELYWICLKRQSESKISNAVFERALKEKATFRGLRTMEKLAAKYPPQPLSYTRADDRGGRATAADPPIRRPRSPRRS